MLDTVPWRSLGIPLICVFIYLGALVGTAETLSRFPHSTPEFTRKIVHIGSGNVILFAWLWKIPMAVGIGAAFIAAIIALCSYFLPILPSLNSVGRQSLGTFFYALSIGILVAWFWSIGQPQFAVLGILIMAWGDGLAALIGRRFGRHPYQVLGNQKSWEGSLTMLGVSFIVTELIFMGTNIPLGLGSLLALAIAMMATILESFSQLGVDNLTVPVGSAAIAFLLCYYFV